MTQESVSSTKVKSSNKNSNSSENATINETNSGNEAADANGAVEANSEAPPLTLPGIAASVQMTKWSFIKALAFRMIIMYIISSFFRQRPPVQPQNSTVSAYSSAPASNLYSAGDVLDMYFYLTENKNQNLTSNDKPIWVLNGLKYGDWNSGPENDGSYSFQTSFPASENLKNNGSLYLHVIVVKQGYYPLPGSADQDLFHSTKYTIHKVKKLTRQRRRNLKRTVNLLTGESDGPEEFKHNASLHGEDAFYLPPVSHWHPNFTINLIEDYTPWTQGSVPEPVKSHLEFYEPSNQYYPIVFLNDYWNLNEDYFPINDTTPVLELSLTYAPLSFFRWQMYAAQTMKQNWWTKMLSGKVPNAADLEGENEQTDQQQSSLGANILSSIQGEPQWKDLDGELILSMDEEHEQDQLKRTLLETNPYLLALTGVVTLLHIVFEMLAFKNDIQFWRTRDSLAGLSVRSIIFNMFQSIVVVLYILHNDTNFAIKISVIIGTLIECWKVGKVLRFKTIWPADRVEEEPGKYWIPRSLPRLEWAYEHTYVESETKVYDQMAFKYLSWALFPLLAGYSVYSLIYHEHLGWYSWVLSTLYGFMLTFGFITMTPQLFINYKMKSVAHLPWRMLTYKALNTFIDDLFAFIIRAPTLYRLGCLRDDVIFFIYLYQRWIYPIDPTRVNEFGVSQEMLEKKTEEIEDKKND